MKAKKYVLGGENMSGAGYETKEELLRAISEIIDHINSEDHSTMFDVYLATR